VHITEDKVLHCRRVKIDKKNEEEEKATKIARKSLQTKKNRKKLQQKQLVRPRKINSKRCWKRTVQIQTKKTRQLMIQHIHYVDWVFRLMILVTSGYVVIAYGLIVSAQQLEVVRGFQLWNLHEEEVISASDSSIVHARLLPHIRNLYLIVASRTYFVCNLFCLVYFNLK